MKVKTLATFRLFSGILRVVILLLVSFSAHGVFMVHEFYMPLPEAQVHASLSVLAPMLGSIMDTVTSLVVYGGGTVIHYDHWEDGYETDLNNPTQGSTQIWGDGNNANGTPPGFTNDPTGLSKGAVISLRNLIQIPRNTNLFYDGRDRVGATTAIAVTRAMWAQDPGPMLAGAVEVTPKMDHGSYFICPVGENVSANYMFEYVGLFVMAGNNNTAVTIDRDGNGPNDPVTVVLNRGDSYHVNGGILKGATVRASLPVQAHLITGDINANFESRWYTLFPFEQWHSSYLTPVGTSSNGSDCYVFVYNPNSFTITINTTTRLGTGSFPVNGNSVYPWLVPVTSGARLESAGEEVFTALSTVGARADHNNGYDWGFTLVPENALTTEAAVGWGPGSSDLTVNGSPVFVSPIEDTTLYVDYNGDGAGAHIDTRGDRYDVEYQVSAYESKTLYDPDKDQTAMRVYTLDTTLFAAAWGQDPAVAGTDNPYLDMGTTVLPSPLATIQKSSTLSEDYSDTGLSVDDIMEYSIALYNNGLIEFPNLKVNDALPSELIYQANSTAVNGIPITDNAGGTAFPLDDAGYIVPLLGRGETMVFTYKVKVAATGDIVNMASLPDFGIVSEHLLQVPISEYPGVNIKTCAPTPNPARPNQRIILSDLNGEFHGKAPDDLIKLSVGFRDASGNWAGGEPQIVISSIPGVTWQPWTGNTQITAPAEAGTYFVWVRSTLNVGSRDLVIQDFKNAHPSTSNERTDARWDASIFVEGDPIEGEEVEGEAYEGEGSDCGVTLGACTLAPNPVNPGQPVELGALKGQYHAGAINETVKIAVGFRNTEGIWTGGDPKVVYTGKPGTAWQPWSGNTTVNAPTVEGDYHVWARATQTTIDNDARQDFQKAIPVDGTRDALWDTVLTVARIYGIRLNACTTPPNPLQPGSEIKLSGLSGQYHGSAAGETVKITIGLRDASGAWTGGEPVVVKSGTPGTAMITWTGSATLTAPTEAGTYTVWVHNTATVNNADAVQDFKDTIPLSADELKDDDWTAGLIVVEDNSVEGEITEGEGEEPSEGEQEGEQTDGEPEEGEGEAPEGEEEPECCCGTAENNKDLLTPEGIRRRLGDLLVLGAALLVLTASMSTNRQR